MFALLPAARFAGFSVIAVALQLVLTEAFASTVQRFGNWIVGCDNEATCAAVGFSNPESGVASQAGPGLRIVLRLVVDTSLVEGLGFEIMRLPESFAINQPVIAHCPQCGLGPRPPNWQRVESMDVSSGRQQLSTDAARDWLEALGQGKAVRVASRDGTFDTTVDSAMFLNAWTTMAETRGNLMRGMPPPPIGVTSAPKVRRMRAYPAHEVRVSGSRLIALLPASCTSDPNAMSVRTFSLPGNAELWSLNCRNGLSRSTHWFHAAGPADLPTPLELPDGALPAIKAGEAGLQDSSFEFDFGVLLARTGPDGRDDCGVQRAWGFDGREWFLLERREMPVCLGLSPPDWIRTYISP